MTEDLEGTGSSLRTIFIALRFSKVKECFEQIQVHGYKIYTV